MDIWREINPELRRYIIIWHRNTPLQQSRLDYFLVSDRLCCHVQEADIKAGYRTDHAIITLYLAFGKTPKISLLWKFNSGFFKRHIICIGDYNEAINVVIEENVAFPYCRDKLREIPRCPVCYFR